MSERVIMVLGDKYFIIVNLFGFNMELFMRLNKLVDWMVCILRSMDGVFMLLFFNMNGLR